MACPHPGALASRQDDDGGRTVCSHSARLLCVAGVLAGSAVLADTALASLGNSGTGKVSLSRQSQDTGLLPALAASAGCDCCGVALLDRATYSAQRPPRGQGCSPAGGSCPRYAVLRASTFPDRLAWQDSGFWYRQRRFESFSGSNYGVRVPTQSSDGRLRQPGPIRGALSFMPPSRPRPAFDLPVQLGTLPNVDHQAAVVVLAGVFPDGLRAVPFQRRSPELIFWQSSQL